MEDIPQIAFGVGTKWFKGDNHNIDGSSLENDLTLSTLQVIYFRLLFVLKRLIFL